ncbi:hypothetical protein E1176_14355 [Fulvivirga sp. RKSG066]|uniref:hypothetical protein n=1 Tax=Fulvivirga aurantia TaxID=2529383 RepID=UPI0012BCE934|nr:hypothetical protein [Fulvivirga aurantia]MTI22210.1 hypothetical protein [Fulvivirga aurantia]
MNNKIYKIGFFVLLVINITIVALIVFKPMRSMKGRGIKQEITKELGFTEEQKATFDNLVKSHRKTMRDIDMRERKLVKTYFDQLTAGTIDNSDQEEKLEEILLLKRKKIEDTYAHFEELKSICTEEQIDEFEEVLSRIVPRLTNAPKRPMNRERSPR